MQEVSGSIPLSSTNSQKGPVLAGPFVFSGQRWHSAVMTITLEISDELKARVDAIAARSSLSPSEVIADALEHGHSLDWQERFLDKVATGVAQADRGDFASDGNLARIVNKYRPT
ncbi:MAG: ribbon-helix-helix protein, CopG family [Hyphomicrobiales bacterium]|nr:MAG: ribbon-helix-helix protein, CopG family [Hyphomicrobiales bacterium]